MTGPITSAYNQWVNKQRNATRQQPEDNPLRFCEEGKHETYQTIRCTTCLRFFCNKHVHNHSPQPQVTANAPQPTQQSKPPRLTFLTALLDIPRAIIYAKATLPMERYANCIRNGKPRPQPLALPPPTRSYKPRQVQAHNPITIQRRVIDLKKAIASDPPTTEQWERDEEAERL